MIPKPATPATKLPVMVLAGRGEDEEDEEDWEDVEGKVLEA